MTGIYPNFKGAIRNPDELIIGEKYRTIHTGYNNCKEDFTYLGKIDNKWYKSDGWGGFKGKHHFADHGIIPYESGWNQHNYTIKLGGYKMNKRKAIKRLEKAFQFHPKLLESYLYKEGWMEEPMKPKFKVGQKVKVIDKASATFNEILTIKNREKEAGWYKMEEYPCGAYHKSWLEPIPRIIKKPTKKDLEELKVGDTVVIKPTKIDYKRKSLDGDKATNYCNKETIIKSFYQGGDCIHVENAWGFEKSQITKIIKTGGTEMGIYSDGTSSNSKEDIMITKELLEEKGACSEGLIYFIIRYGNDSVSKKQFISDIQNDANIDLIEGADRGFWINWISESFPEKVKRNNNEEIIVETMMELTNIDNALWAARDRVMELVKKLQGETNG